jgi:hypothetical protein
MAPLVAAAVVVQLQLSELAQPEPIIYLPVVLVVEQVLTTPMVMVRLQEKMQAHIYLLEPTMVGLVLALANPALM